MTALAILALVIIAVWIAGTLLLAQLIKRLALQTGSMVSGFDYAVAWLWLPVTIFALIDEGLRALARGARKLWRFGMKAWQR